MRHIAILIALLSVLASCDNNNEFTTSPSHELRFSTDTISFDTVFATVPTVTKTLVVYNDCAKGLRINTIRLAQDTNNSFRVNVDGESLDAVIHNIDLYGKDSLFVFVEATLPQSDDNTILEVEGALIFSLESGVEQRVALTGSSLHGILHREAVVLSNDTEFDPNDNHVFYNSLIVNEGTTLRLQAGTTLYFSPTSSLQVYGTLIAEGTLQQPVVLRGDRIDNLFDYLPYDNTVGRWQGVHFHSSSKANSLTYTDIHSGSYGIRADSTDLTITNSVVHNVDGDALRLLSTKARVINSQFSNAHGHCVSVYGGDADFTFCTLAQFYPWQGDRGDALFIADRMLDRVVPIEHLNFSSCLITGYADDVIMGDLQTDTYTDYRFAYCVLRTPAVDDENHYFATTWENHRSKDLIQGTSHFNTFDTTNFLYDLRPINKPDSVSIAVGVASPLDAQRYPTDRLGVERAERPTAGCYEPTSYSQ